MSQNNPLPLSHIKVLDLTHHRAGPTCVRQLVDMGAQAIKIEQPGHGGEGDDGMGGRRHGFDFQNLHRNKKSMTLNLKHPEGLEIFKRLVKDADVVAENYRAGVKKRLGIDYETLRAINPRIVYGSISGFGQTGPYSGRPGVDQIAQGMAGLMSVTGLPGQGPVRVGIPIGDLCAGIFLAQGILVALVERQVTGQGKWVHTSLLEAILSMLDFQAARWLMKGQVAGQTGNGHPTGAATNSFVTSDGHINIGAAGDEQFKRFCHAVGRPELHDDARFRNAEARAAHRPELLEVMNSITRTNTMAHWVQVLNDAGCPCGPIYKINESFADPQVQHIKMAQPAHSKALGDFNLLGHPVQYGDQRPAIRMAAPEEGEHTEEVLMGIGYTRDQIADLAKRGVI